MKLLSTVKIIRLLILTAIALPLVGGFLLALGASRGLVLPYIANLFDYLQEHPWTIVFAFLFRILLLLPVSVLLLACGAVFGPARGEAVAVCGLLMSGTVEFLLARFGWRELRRSSAAVRVFGEPLRTWIADRPFLGLLTLRLACVPFDLANLISAWAALPTSRFMLATAIGVVPAAWPVVCAGSLFDFSAWLHNGTSGLPPIRLGAGHLILSIFTLVIALGSARLLRRQVHPASK